MTRAFSKIIVSVTLSPATGFSKILVLWFLCLLLCQAQKPEDSSSFHGQRSFETNLMLLAAVIDFIEYEKYDAKTILQYFKTIVTLVNKF